MACPLVPILRVLGLIALIDYPFGVCNSPLMLGIYVLGRYVGILRWIYYRIHDLGPLATHLLFAL
jgi:hypothetical protein